MKAFQWLHIPLRRGLSMMQERGLAYNFANVAKDSSASAWALIGAPDASISEASPAEWTIYGLMIAEVRENQQVCGHIAWLDVPQRESKSVIADWLSLAMARWIEANHFFLLRGNPLRIGSDLRGVALTREMVTDGGRSTVLRWISSRKLFPQEPKKPTRTTGKAGSRGGSSPVYPRVAAPAF